ARPGPLLPALPAPGDGRRARPSAPGGRDARDRGEWGVGQSADLRRNRRSAIGRKFSRRARGLRRGHDRIGVVRDRQPRRTAHGHARRPSALRTSCLPHPRTWAQFGLHDSAGHRRGPGFRKQAASDARERRFDSDLGQSGGSCQHGSARRASARSNGLERRRDPRHRIARRRAGLRFPRRARIEPPDRGRARAAAGCRAHLEWRSLHGTRHGGRDCPRAFGRSGHSARSPRGRAMNAPRIQRGTEPLVVAFPHGGTDLAGLDDQFISPARALLDTDWWIEDLYAFAADMGATLIASDISRSVIDMNRDPSGASLYPGQATTELCPSTTFDGAPLYRFGEPDEAEITRRLQLYHRPYHEALSAELARLRDAHGR